jgi:hypothetical protein
MTGVCHHILLLLVEMGVLLTIWLGWPQATVLLISASQVAGITGVSTVPSLELDFFISIY